MGHIERMEIEFKELSTKIAKGRDFFEKQASKFLDDTQFHNLEFQLKAMELYHRILRARIEYDKKMLTEELIK